MSKYTAYFTGFEDLLHRAQLERLFKALGRRSGARNDHDDRLVDPSLGGHYITDLAKRDAPLICISPTDKNIEHVQKHNIPVVSPDWLYAIARLVSDPPNMVDLCMKAGRMSQTDPYDCVYRRRYWDNGDARVRWPIRRYSPSRNRRRPMPRPRLWTRHQAPLFRRRRHVPRRPCGSLDLRWSKQTARSYVTRERSAVNG